MQEKDTNFGCPTLSITDIFPHSLRPFPSSQCMPPPPAISPCRSVILPEPVKFIYFYRQSFYFFHRNHALGFELDFYQEAGKNTILS